MSVLTVINGVYKEEFYKQAESYAFREGLRTRSLELFLQKNGGEDDDVILILADGEALRKLKKDLFLVLALRFPIIFLPDSVWEWNLAQQELENVGCRTLYPFQYQNFCETVRSCVDPRTWEERTCAYGRMEICPANRTVRLDGSELRMRQIDFDILLILLENIGHVVSRQYINDKLPSRMRSTQRNVDTHISSIRQQSRLGNAIRCVRSVGYCISEEALHEFRSPVAISGGMDYTGNNVVKGDEKRSGE